MVTDALLKNGFGIAKREGNAKRPYLIINRFQAKHIPVSPNKAWNMMLALSDLLCFSDQCTVVVAFAETATAIGAAVAMHIGSECFFIHSTRANVPKDISFVDFEESHSHAVDHHLFINRLAKHINKVNHIVFVDDEYTTGRTLRNALSSVQKLLDNKKAVDILAVSIVDRIDEENFKLLDNDGIRVLHLIGPNEIHLDYKIDDIAGVRAPSVRGNASSFFDFIDCQDLIPDPRMGVEIGDYIDACEHTLLRVKERLSESIKKGSRIVVLGTEECMFPSIVLGRMLENSKFEFEVFCHATTRSPISVSECDGYPISNGYELRSAYDAKRSTFLYNLQRYDLVVVVSDAPKDTLASGANDLFAAFASHGCQRFKWVMI